MDSLKFLTSVYQKALGCGVFSVNEVISFCDKVIERLENTPIEIIEASLMQSKKVDNIENTLCGYHRMNYDEYTVRIMLSIIANKFCCDEFDTARLIRCCSKILLHSGLCYESEYYHLYNMEDVYDLAEGEVYGDIKAISAEFKEKIMDYISYYNEFIWHTKRVFIN